MQKWLTISILLSANCFAIQAEDDFWNSGLVYDEFKLTLAPGERTEVIGPLFYHQESEGATTRAVPPLFSCHQNPELDSIERDFLYPVMTYDRYGGQYRWQFFQLLSISGGETQTEEVRDRFTLYPILFRQRSSDPDQCYTALLPLYGHLLNRFNRDEIFFVAFPAYAQTVRRGVVTDNYLYPIFHLRHGPGLSGWQVFPLAGHEMKEITTRTNRFGDLETVPGYERLSLLWPIFANQHNGLGTTNPDWQQQVLPLYYFHRSAARDQTTVLWPFFSHIDDRGRGYEEWQVPWPFVAVARGEGKTATRVWPLFSVGRTPFLESRTYLWPLYRYRHLQSAPLDRERTRILFFLYSDVKETHTETGKTRQRRDLWPLFTRQVDFNGNTRLQVLSLLEPLVPVNKSIERNYSPVYALWRSEFNGVEQRRSQSLLWNLYRRETSPGQSQTSCLFGLFQQRTGPDGKQLRLFYIPFGKGKSQVEKMTEFNARFTDFDALLAPDATDSGRQ